MRIVFVHIVFVFLLASCKKSQVDKPVWINKTDTLFFFFSEPVFSASDKSWTATLFTTTQPVAYCTTFENGKLVLKMQEHIGVIEGPAQIGLSFQKQHFFYPVFIKNNPVLSFIDKEYRSPKTVNPDSGLHQQRILHRFDLFRNLYPNQVNANYFFFFFFTLAPKAGVYRAVKDEALSAYYVQPGSCTTIAVHATFNAATNCFNVVAGPLKDIYQNTVANGTLVIFKYTDNKQSFRMEAALLDGYATVVIPAALNTTYSLTAQVNQTISKQIILTR